MTAAGGYGDVNQLTYVAALWQGQPDSCRWLWWCKPTDLCWSIVTGAARQLQVALMLYTNQLTVEVLWQGQCDSCRWWSKPTDLPCSIVTGAARQLQVAIVLYTNWLLQRCDRGSQTAAGGYGDVNQVTVAALWRGQPGSCRWLWWCKPSDCCSIVTGAARQLQVVMVM